MILRTYEQCLKAVSSNNIIVATDSKKILNFLKIRKINNILTSKKCLTGTDRVAEVAKKIKSSIYINLQGDEPFFNPNDIKKMIKFALKNSNLIINGYTKINEEKIFRDFSIPKVLIDKKNNLIYMSRSTIPGNKNNKFVKGWRQVCIYSYPRKVLMNFNNKRKTLIEKIEDIEILRFLELGYKIKMLKLSNSSFSIDTKQDLKIASEFFKKKI